MFSGVLLTGYNVHTPAGGHARGPYRRYLARLLVRTGVVAFLLTVVLTLPSFDRLQALYECALAQQVPGFGRPPPPCESEEPWFVNAAAPRPVGPPWAPHQGSLADETRGKPITIAGRTVQLPPDAFVVSTAPLVNCGGSACPDFPSMILQRGQSSVYVGMETGRVVPRHVAPGEEHAFDFLRDALR